MGPEAAKSFAGQALVRPVPTRGPAERAKQELDYGRRGKGYIFGAFQPVTGEAFTQPYARRTTANWLDSLRVERVEGWLPASCERVYAILGNLSMHRATDVLLFSLAHPLGVCLPAQMRRVPEPDRPVVEDLALAGAQRPSLRNVGGHLPGD